MIDGYVCVKSFDDATREGSLADVPYMIGFTLNDMGNMAPNIVEFCKVRQQKGGKAWAYQFARPEFVDAFDQAACTGTYVNVHLRSPYTNITKADIAHRGKTLGIDYSKTWSCYKGGEQHCGKCGTCVERREAFALAGIDDKTAYLEAPTTFPLTT